MSLRARLLLAVGAATLVALLAADLATYSALRAFLYQRVDQSLAQARPGPGRGPAGRPDPRGDDPVAGRGAFVATRSASTGAISVSQPARTASGATVQLDLDDVRATRGRPTFLTVGSTPGETSYRVRATRAPNGDVQIVALPLDDAQATLDRLLVVEVVVTLGALAVATAVGWSLVRLGLHPLLQVEQTAAAIADGQLDRRVPGDRAPTEVGRLARVLNTMLDRIETAFEARDRTEAELRRSEERMRRFVADASHELRTPLSAVSAYAELYERGAKDHPEDLDRLLRGIRSESARMAVLVDDLLLLARLDEGRPLRQEPVAVDRLAAEAAAAATAVGPAWPVTLVVEEPVEVVGDVDRLRQVLDNLLANARAHTPQGTAVTVSVGRDGDAAVVVVRDEGPGMVDADAARIFERFFRVDPSRARAPDSGGGAGSGLGLSIVAAIVAAHGGTVGVHTATGAGAAFQVRIPCAPTSAPTTGA